VVEKTQVEENVQPVAEVKVAENNTPTDNNSQENSLISGEKISQVNCILCHGAGVMGAPKIGDAAQWEARIAQASPLLGQLLLLPLQLLRVIQLKSQLRW
jgi:cytochrome c5